MDGTRGSPVIPPYVSIFDSSPAGYAYDATVNAVLSSLRPGLGRTLVVPAVHLLSATWWLYVHGLGKTDPMTVYGRSVNDRGRKAEGEVRRCYIYSEDDVAVSARHVERHAREARIKGFSVRMEKFEKSGHVSHARVDPERYWNIVQEMWYGK